MHFIHLFFFQSNGREIRHVILVSVSWHTLLSITAHLYFVLFLRSLWFFHNIATLLICAHQLVSLFYHVTTGTFHGSISCKDAGGTWYRPSEYLCTDDHDHPWQKIYRKRK